VPNALAMTTLVLGGVRSGKSARAIALARATRKRVIVAATAAVDPTDHEMVERVARHRRDRPAEWTVVETVAPGGPSLPAVLRDAPADACVLVDALGTWLGAHLLAWEARAQRDPAATLAALDALGAELADTLAQMHAEAIVIAEETGWGLVPTTRLGRLFSDALGRLTQRIAVRADRVELVVAGYAIDLRAIGRPVDQP
jgi:adenosylcobinamide kinase/adenosylcobinamide-phosphate guanylyltransferase